MNSVNRKKRLDWAFEANWSIPVGGTAKEPSEIEALAMVVAAVELGAVVTAVVEMCWAVAVASSLVDEVHEVVVVE